jgi:hypothetical protein
MIPGATRRQATELYGIGESRDRNRRFRFVVWDGLFRVVFTRKVLVK